MQDEIVLFKINIYLYIYSMQSSRSTIVCSVIVSASAEKSVRHQK